MADGVPRTLSLSDPLSATLIIAALTNAGSSLSEDEPTSASGFAPDDAILVTGVDAVVGDFAGVDVANGAEFVPAGVRDS